MTEQNIDNALIMILSNDISKENNMEKILNHIEAWLKEYCIQSKLNGFVVGVSGGIDSAVTSTLCAKTKLEVIALNMPIYQSNEQITLSESHIKWLESRFDNVRGVTIDLTPCFQKIEETLLHSIQDSLTMANTRSRFRMITLYAFANHHKLLVAGTGNKVEDFGVGFYTKYGDGGVDISPIADLLKTEVFALGKYLGINEEILKAPPTDGLWEDGRTDESQIGASYPELEWAMKFEQNANCIQLSANQNDVISANQKENISAHQKEMLSSRQKKVLTIYRRLNQINRHKMEAIPVCRIPDDLKIDLK